jgi:hypothetical protein
MKDESPEKKLIDDTWYWYLTGETRPQVSTQPQLARRVLQLLFDVLPANRAASTATCLSRVWAVSW